MRVFILAILFMMARGQYHRGESKDPDRIVFPTSSHRQSRGPSELSAILKFAKEMSLVETAEDFLTQVRDVPPIEHDFLANRFGTIERANVDKPKAAVCNTPELQTVPLKEAGIDSSTIYFPLCTRVKRCGGCCNHQLLSCQPTATEMRNFQVFVTRLDENRRPVYRGKEIVPLIEHLNCTCGCKVKAEHCSSKHVYIEDECSCLCKNEDEEAKCKQFNHTKLWDPDSCSCTCRDSLACTTGSYFDQNTCSCTKLPVSRRQFGGESGTGYSFQKNGGLDDNPPVIVTLDADNPRRRQKDDPEYK